jgi:hypothetical protein
VSVDTLVVNPLDVVALVVGAGVAVGRGRNGSADSGQGGPVRSRGGSSTERWRSGPVRSLISLAPLAECSFLGMATIRDRMGIAFTTLDDNNAEELASCLKSRTQ